MVKLPIYEQQVQPDTAVIPSAPKNTGNPGLVLSSMNKNAEAVQNAAQAVGDAGQKLYAHAQKLQTLQLKKKNAEFDTQFRQELQDKLYSPDEETVTVNGQDITRPKGIYNRSLKQAEGSRAEFEDYYATTRQKYLSQVSDPEAQLALANSLDNQFLSARDNVYSHEAKQMREDLVNGFKSNISQQIKDAANATDLRSLTESVNNAVDTQKSLNDALGLDAATAKLAEQKTIADVIESSTSAALMKDMSGATSMKLLDAAKDVLDQKDYDELANGIKVKSKKIIEDTKASVKLAKNINSTKILMEVAGGNFNVFNVKELNRMANNGEISNEAATAAIRAIEKPISDYDIKPDDEAFMERAKGIFEASNPADMEKNLIDVLDGFSSGNLSQERMTLLFQAANGQGSEKATAYRENFKKIYDWGVDAGVPVTYQSQVAKDYVEGINAGKDPVEAAEVAIKRATASQDDSVGAENLRVSENPKENIGFSDRVMTSPVMNTLFEGLTKFSQNRAVRVIGLGQAGMVEGVGGAAKLVGLKDFGNAVSKEAKLMQKTFEIKDPKFLDKLGMGASSSLSFFVPGLAVAKGVNMLRAAPVIAVALGVSTSSVMESSVEAGSNYEEAKRRGMTDEQAKQVGGVTFWLNMPLLVGTNVLGGLFNPEGQAIKQAGKKMTVDRIIKAVAEKGIKPAVAEGTQEGLQQVSQNVAIGDPALEGAREAAVIGAIVGSGLGAVTSFDSGSKTKDVPAVKTDDPTDNTVKDSTGKPLEINTEADQIAQEIAAKRAVVSGALAGVETISNNGNSKEVALNQALASNFEIINGFTNFDTKMEAVKEIDRSLFEYFMQDGKSRDEAATLSAQISQQAKQEFIQSNNTEKFRETLVKILRETLPSWRLTAPDILTVNESQDSLKKTIAEGEKIVKDGGINGKSLPQEDLDIIKESTVEARQGAARVKQIIKNNLIAIDIPEEQAEASARLWESRALRASKDRGITPMEWYDQNKVDIIRSEDIAPEGALKQGEISPLHAEALKYRSAEEFVNKTINKSKINAFSENGNLIVQTQVTPDDLQKQGLASQKLVDTIIKEKAQYVTPSTLSSGGKALFNSLEKKGILEKVDDETYTARMLRKQPVGTYKVNTDKLESLKTKSQLTAIYNEAHGIKGNDNVLFQSDKSKPFYSQLERTIEEKMPNSAPVDQVRGILKQPGVKQEEIDWLDVEGFLKGKTKVTKQELLDYIRANQVEVKEVLKGDNPNEKLKSIEDEMKKAGYTIEKDMAGEIDVYDEQGDIVDPDVLEENNPRIFDLANQYERIRGDYGAVPGELTKFQNYQLPGGENYREMLLTLPVKNDVRTGWIAKLRGAIGGQNQYEIFDADGKWVADLPANSKEEAIQKVTRGKSEGVFKSPHFDEPNILAHVRMNDRVDADGRKVLFLEEVQSDWHQKGKKEGYRRKGESDTKIEQFLADDRLGRNTNQALDELIEQYNLQGPDYAQELERIAREQKEGVPDAPFKKTWYELALKRMLRYAAEKGYDKLAWTTGEQQAERYDLSKQVNNVRAFKRDDGTYDLTAKTTNGTGPHDFGNKIPADKIVDFVGKDLAEKILNQPDGWHTYEGQDLKVGGEGMKGFYDQILPSFMNKYAKKWGGRVGETQISNAGEQQVGTRAGGGRLKPGGYALIDSTGLFRYAGPSEDSAREFARSAGMVGYKIVKNDIEGFTKVHSLELTPSMKDSVMQGQPLFQSDARGWVDLTKAEKRTIVLSAKADASTFMHETAHIWLEDIKKAGNKEWQDVKNWLGIKGDTITRDQHETFARGLEKYLGEGKAPNPKLTSVFEKFKAWIKGIYSSLDKLNVDLSPEVARLFNNMFEAPYVSQEEKGGDLYGKGQRQAGQEEGLLLNAEPGATPARVMPTGTVKKSAAYQRALERYTEELKGQPEASYTTINLADQMARAVKFVDENPALAKKIAYGMEPAPSGLRESAVSIAYNEKMYQEGNMKEFGKSYRSRSLRQTVRGQEIVLERAAEVNQNHPLYFARQVIEARTAQAGKKLFEISKENKPDAPAKRAYKEINEKSTKLKKEVVDAKTLDIAEAQKIIDSLIC